MRVVYGTCSTTQATLHLKFSMREENGSCMMRHAAHLTFYPSFTPIVNESWLLLQQYMCSRRWRLRFFTLSDGGSSGSCYN